MDVAWLVLVKIQGCSYTGLGWCKQGHVLKTFYSDKHL